jgi:hypothetical protein
MREEIQLKFIDEWSASTSYRMAVNAGLWQKQRNGVPRPQKYDYQAVTLGGGGSDKFGKLGRYQDPRHWEQRQKLEADVSRSKRRRYR